MTNRLWLSGAFGVAPILYLARQDRFVGLAPFDALDQTARSWCDSRAPIRHVLGAIDRRVGILCQEGDGYYGLFALDLEARAAGLIYPSIHGMPLEIAPGLGGSWLVARAEGSETRTVDRMDPNGHVAPDLKRLNHWMHLPRWDGVGWTDADPYRVRKWSRDFTEKKRFRWDRVANVPPDDWDVSAEGTEIERRAVWWHDDAWWLIIERRTKNSKYIDPFINSERPFIDANDFRMVSPSGEWRRVPNEALEWQLGWFANLPREALWGVGGQDTNARYDAGPMGFSHVVRAKTEDGHEFVLRETPVGFHLMNERGDSFLLRTRNRYELVIDEHGDPLLIGIDRPRMFVFNGYLQLVTDFEFAQPGAFDAEHPVIVPGSLSGGGTRPPNQRPAP